ncbi:helix-turn-helix transcriptional regulator [Streptomyces sp. NPDC001422]|uniref:helix-turn-helix transcriptional regulator n=1 Tax=Streptomyces sp. NPDC001422 TaxID=3364575 RepID=UPI00368196E9
MNVTEIAAEHGVSRQTIHTYRRAGVFPSPVAGEGSTRLRFREDEVVAFFKANPKQPRKKRHFPPNAEGDLVATTAEPREWRLTPETLDQFVRALVNEVDYDIHKNYECGEEDGEDHYPELVAEAAKMLDAIFAKGTEAGA